jgi:2-iminobutanoate/2-iminopropanoate deaminase
MIERIFSPGTPPPQGPYSPAVRAGDYIYVSGQIPVDPATGQVPAGGIGPETRQTLTNIQKILEGAGASMSQVVRCGVFLVDAADFKPMNAVYTEFFNEAKPARTTIIVAALPLPGARIEIDAIAYVGK